MKKEMNVLSLFDGISCGRVALERAKIKVDNYYSSEIDKYAIKVSENNYSDIIRLGDVTGWRDWDIDWSSIDLLIGGSPCQGFSLAGKQLNFKDPRSKLFFEFVDILNHINDVNPNVKFLLENVKMKKDYLNVISEKLGVEPMFINSSLVSAQNRRRYYWFNWSAELPNDKGIMLNDILEIKSLVELENKTIKDGKTYAITASYNGAVAWNSIERKQRSMVPISDGGEERNDFKKWRKLTPVECERLQTLPDNYTEGVSNTQRYKMLGNGWTVDVVAHIFKSLNIK